MNGEEAADDLVGTDLWRDHDGAEGARLKGYTRAKKLNSQAKGQSVSNACLMYAWRSGLIKDLTFYFIMQTNLPYSTDGSVL